MISARAHPGDVKTFVFSDGLSVANAHTRDWNGVSVEATIQKLHAWGRYVHIPLGIDSERHLLSFRHGAGFDDCQIEFATLGYYTGLVKFVVAAAD